MFIFRNKSIILLALSLLLAACGGQQETKPVVRGVYAIEVKARQSLPRRSFPGKAKAVEEANLSFEVSGTLNKLPIKIGDKMKQGALIAVLDKRDFIAKLNSTKAELERSTKNLARAKKLLAKDFVSASEYDRIFAAAEVNQANVDLAKKALEDTDITAPFDGVITQKYVENFEAVRAKQNIARILDISEIEMQIEIPENLISRLKRIKTVEVIFDSYPKHPFIATIKEVGKEASRTTRTYPITLIMKQAKDFKILPGMSGSAKAKDMHEETIKDLNYLVPLAAVFTPNDEKQNYIWLVDTTSHTVSKQKVTVVTINSRGAYIKEGIKPGQWVVAAGVHQLREGQKIKLLKEARH